MGATEPTKEGGGPEIGGADPRRPRRRLFALRGTIPTWLSVLFGLACVLAILLVWQYVTLGPAEERIVQKRKELAEFKSLMERRQRQVDQPSAYQRERGELTAYVISSSANDVTVRVKESGRVMVLRVRKWRRVEGQRVENREEMNFVKRLKKDELIWVNYTEGEERGSFFILEIKRVGK